MLEFVSSIQVRSVFPSEERSFVFYADAFSFEPTPADDDAGLIYNCDRNFVVDTPEKEILSFFSRSRSCIVTLKDSSCRLYDIGTADIPARVYLQPHLNKTRLIMSCRMLSNPLL